MRLKTKHNESNQPPQDLSAKCCDCFKICDVHAFVTGGGRGQGPDSRVNTATKYMYNNTAALNWLTAITKLTCPYT